MVIKKLYFYITQTKVYFHFFPDLHLVVNV